MSIVGLQVLQHPQGTCDHTGSIAQPLPDKYRCPLCKLILFEPCQTACGHRLCHRCCIFLSREPTPKCPVDGEILVPKEIFRDMCCEREILQLTCYCKNQNQGCGWTGKLAELEEHASHCPYREITCPNPGCTTKVLYRQLDQHLQSICTFKKTPCVYCGQLVIEHEKEAHGETCVKFPVRCPEGCGSADLPRDMLDDHLTNHCPLAEISCTFSNAGCPFKGSRGQVKEHCLESLNEHSELLAKGMSSLDLKQTQAAQEVEAVKGENARMATQLNTLRETLAAAVQDLRVQQSKISNYERILSEHRKEFGQFRRRLDTLQERETGEQFGAQLEEFRIVIREHDVKLGNLERNMVRGSAPPSGRAGGSGASTSSMSLERRLDRNEHQLALHDINLAEHDVKIQMLEATSYDGKYIWKIDDWSRRFKDSASGKTPSIYSPPFYVGRFGYKVCARVYPNGDGAGKDSHLSLFFVIMRGEYDALLPWPFHHKVTFRLLDQGHHQDVTDTFRPDPNSSSFKKPTSNMNIASGCPKFISHTDLQTGGYARGNTLFIKILVDMSGSTSF